MIGKHMRLGLMAAVALVMVAGCGTGSARFGRSAPAESVLRQLCEAAYETAGARLADAGPVTKTQNSMGLTGGAGSVTCDGDAWLLDGDEGSGVKVEMALIFKTVADPSSPETDYCDTDGVTVQVPSSGFEARKFGKHPYCFSWYRGDPAQSASSSYVDRSTEVYLMWNVDSTADVFAGDQPDEPLSSANDAVLAGIYAGFGEAD